MITNILLLLWILFLLATPAVVLYNKYCLKTSFAFQNFKITEIPYIVLDIQGNQLNMIVDTGCGISMINQQTIEEYNLLCTDSGKSVSLSAVTSDQITANAVTIEFNIGNNEFKEDFFVHNTEDFGNFQAMHGIKIHGLLGSSFFDNYNCKIDYKKHSLIID